MWDLLLSALLGLGGVGFITGLLFRFTFAAPLAAMFPAVAKILAGFAEAVLYLVQWFFGSLFKGLTELCQIGWRGWLAVAVIAAGAGWYADRYDPVRSHLPPIVQSREPDAPAPAAFLPETKPKAKRKARVARNTKPVPPRTTIAQAPLTPECPLPFFCW